jgi:hypothetical protein
MTPKKWYRANAELVQLAAHNIALEIGDPPFKAVLVIYSPEKCDLAVRIAAQISARGLESYRLELAPEINAGQVALKELVHRLASQWGLVLLIEPRHADFLFETVGRPDAWFIIPTDHLFCDWLIQPAGLIRTYGIDMDELRQFRQALLTQLYAAHEIHITTQKGTDITVNPRGWNLTNGEVFTAPLENIANGRILVDGCAYGNPPKIPFLLIIESGRVVNLTDLDQTDEQQSWVYQDLTRDGNASTLAEFGIGINPGARREEDLMEAEQARGTCHFGFGNNIAYGGQNKSSYHFDLVIKRPTIEVDGKEVCRAGKFLFPHAAHLPQLQAMIK